MKSCIRDCMNILFLDDNIYRYDSFMKLMGDQRVCWAKTAQEAIDLLKERKIDFDEIWLDHDLSDEHYEGKLDSETGQRVVNYISKHSDVFNNTDFIVHTLNPVGAENMCACLDSVKGKYKCRVFRAPFGWQNKHFIGRLRKEKGQDVEF